MAFMGLEITHKGTLASADCSKCGQTMYIHERASWDFNIERITLETGTACCKECSHYVDKETYSERKGMYAGRYSAPGYMDCTDWHYDTNKRRLEKELRAMYA